ncbi:DUF2946 family protein [Sphingomonas sp. Leaf4]|uniref:DUF2946 family protein n=1 Tax=Sphingomonas sp. Leaf4 TaxID=2876553 RepID=UPI001E593C00|nr:DUF2946 family protein [Sphingomonas sp. Leaf4]
MQAFRHLLAQRNIAVLICAMTLLLKLLVPTGYMIGNDHGTLNIMICSGTGARSVAMGMPGMTHDMAAMHATMSDHGKSGDQGKPEVPCAYSGLSAQVLGTVDPIILSAALSVVAKMELLGSPRPAQRPVPYLRPPLRGPPHLPKQ